MIITIVLFPSVPWCVYSLAVDIEVMSSPLDILPLLLCGAEHEWGVRISRSPPLDSLFPDCFIRLFALSLDLFPSLLDVSPYAQQILSCEHS
jgi:hypothetical protein